MQNFKIEWSFADTLKTKAIYTMQYVMVEYL